MSVVSGGLARDFAHLAFDFAGEIAQRHPMPMVAGEAAGPLVAGRFRAYGSAAGRLQHAVYSGNPGRNLTCLSGETHGLEHCGPAADIVAPSCEPAHRPGIDPPAAVGSGFSVGRERSGSKPQRRLRRK